MVLFLNVVKKWIGRNKIIQWFVPFLSERIHHCLRHWSVAKFSYRQFNRHHQRAPARENETNKSKRRLLHICKYACVRFTARDDVAFCDFCASCTVGWCFYFRYLSPMRAHGKIQTPMTPTRYVTGQSPAKQKAKSHSLSLFLNRGLLCSIYKYIRYICTILHCLSLVVCTTCLRCTLDVPL